ncbi:MAG: GNAT family N-acetyltransferase [Coriobacteriia bacterium]|nr:GNAT family N-acetyltransferase [Coriobacteriia bacterium]
MSLAEPAIESATAPEPAAAAATDAPAPAAPLKIRVARPQDDAAAVAAIYAPYVEQTAITFEYVAPDAAEMARRMAATLKRYPYLVAENAQGRIRGYAYASAFKSRAAYDWSVETSIYVEQGYHGHGLGRQLQETLEGLLAVQGVRNVNACIAFPPTADDPYLTDGSIRFHLRLGFQPVGTFHDCASKFGRWYHMAWMEKHIGPHQPGEPKPLVPFAQLNMG